ncbi:MAG: NHL repeat-containing protein [Bacteroidota bacterium]|nr:NHL repeat-containing protein [Bacteroidota bacterium]
MFLLIAALWVSGDFSFAKHQTEDSILTIGDFKRASALSIDPLGNLYVVDRGANEIIKIEKHNNKIRRTGGRGWKSTALDEPTDINTPNGLDIYVADYGNHRILRYDRNLNFVSSYPTEEKTQSIERIIGFPRSIAFSRFGDLFILEGENNRILKINSSNKIERTFGGVDAGKGRLIKPIRIRVSNRDRMYVLDQNNIVMFDIYGNYIRTLGNESFKRLRSVGIYDNTLYALDSCSIMIIDLDGTMKNQITIPSQIMGKNTEIIDFAVQRDLIYLLTEHRIMIYRIKI